MLRIVMFEIPTSLNQFPSADENDVDDDTSDNDGSEHDDGHCIDNVSKHGYVKRRNVLNPERCKYACDYFKAAANSRAGDTSLPTDIDACLLSILAELKMLGCYKLLRM